MIAFKPNKEKLLKQEAEAKAKKEASLNKEPMGVVGLTLTIIAFLVFLGSTVSVLVLANIVAMAPPRSSLATPLLMTILAAYYLIRDTRRRWRKKRRIRDGEEFTISSSSKE